MKKFIVLSALAAVASMAFVACSSDDDLAQQPKAPETIVDNGSSQGTPFSVNPSSDATRADRYGSSAWGNYDGEHPTDFVDCFKLYGKQEGLSAWIDNVVFTRDKTGAKANIWGPNRNSTSNITSLNWPTDDTGTLVKESAVATKFYAITDNAITDLANGNNVTGVTSWMGTEGQFDYASPKTTAEVLWDDPDKDGSTFGVPGTFDTREKTIVDRTQIRDLMYATTTMTEEDVTDGELPLPFHHALSGLSIRAQYISHGEYNSNAADNGYATVKAVYVCGLNTSGTFTMNPVNTEEPVVQSHGGTGAWSAQGIPSIYYYELPGEGETFYCIDNTAANVANPSNRKTIVPIGEWLVIPQTTTAKAWSMDYDTGFLPNPSTTAYIILDIVDKLQAPDHLFLCYPLDTTFNPGKTRVITVDIAQGRCCDLQDSGKCALYYIPGDVITSRQFEMDFEENK